MQHIPAHYEIADGKLMLGGRSISEIALTVGRTPFYAYDSQLIQQRIRCLRHALPSSIKINYAIKANPFKPLLEVMEPLVDGFDIASAGELNLVRPLTDKTISFAGPGKQRHEIELAITHNAILHVESSHELDCILEAAQNTGKKARICIRINPDFELKTAGMKMGGGPKPFGVDAEKIPEMLMRITGEHIEFEGFHVYPGSQNLKAGAIAHAQRESYQLICRLTEHAPSPVKRINLGGGFGIPYFPGEQALELTPICEALEHISQDAANRFPGALIEIELGRYLVGEAGVYITRVIDKKESRGHLFLIVDGGMHHHLAASGNFGQVIRKNYPVANAHRMNQIGQDPVLTIAGPLCTPLDVLAENIRIGQVEIGDLIVVFQSGAYGASSSPQQFLGHPPPEEIVL